jgi:hypothetical protein
MIAQVASVVGRYAIPTIKGVATLAGTVGFAYLTFQGGKLAKAERDKVDLEIANIKAELAKKNAATTEETSQREEHQHHQ